MRAEKKKDDLARIKKVVELEDGDIVVAIEKFGLLNCLFHSSYGLLCFLSLVITIANVVFGSGTWAIVSGILCLFCWAKAWLVSNDKLKERIYLVLLEGTLLKREMIEAPFVTAQLNVHTNTMECITNMGELQKFEIEVIQEKLPLYVVKIYLEGGKD